MGSAFTKMVNLPIEVPDAPEKLQLEVVTVGSMRERDFSQLKIGKDKKVGQGVKKSFL